MLSSSPPRVPCSTSQSSPVVGMQRRRLDVAMADRPDLRADAFLADKRVVLRNRSVRVDADDLADQAVHVLRLHAPRGDRSIALRDEERAVAVPDQPAAVVLRASPSTAPGDRSPGRSRRAAPRRRRTCRARPRCCSSRSRPARSSSSRSAGSTRTGDRAARRAGRPGRARRRPGRPVTAGESVPSLRDDAQAAGLLGDQHLARRAGTSGPTACRVLRRP